MSIFKAYDIRGIYKQDLDEELAYKIGRAFVSFLKCKTVMVGVDMRKSSLPLYDALVKGINEEGADVINIGLCSTPLFYFGTGKLNVDAGIMVTASHNPKEYNGFKLCKKGAVPISGDTGIKEIEKLVLKNDFKPSKTRGVVTKKDVKKDYINSISKHYSPTSGKLKIVADCANSVGALELEVLKSLKNLEIIPLFEEMTGEFENHEANPLKVETLLALQKTVLKEKADLGIAFDGDADRVGFVDEKGNVIPMDIITAIISKSILEKGKQTILYDLRSSKVVKEVIEENKGIAVQCRVGHAFIKKQMRDNDAFFAGELSGHFYFKDNYTTESSSLAALYIINLMLEQKKKISEVAYPLLKYSHSGEINSKVSDVNETIKKIEEKYSGKGEKLTLDGISFYFKDWWFNVRASNTEPLIRLNLEADSKKVMEQKRNEVLKLIRG